MHQPACLTISVRKMLIYMLNTQASNMKMTKCLILIHGQSIVTSTSTASNTHGYHKIKSKFKQKQRVAQQCNWFCSSGKCGHLLHLCNWPLTSWSLLKLEGKIRPHTFFLPAIPSAIWSSVFSEESFTVWLPVLSFSTII